MVTVAQFCEPIKNTELYTFKGLIVWSMNYILIKLFPAPPKLNDKVIVKFKLFIRWSPESSKEKTPNVILHIGYFIQRIILQYMNIYTSQKTLQPLIFSNFMSAQWLMNKWRHWGLYHNHKLCLDSPNHGSKLGSICPSTTFNKFNHQTK